jgi:hypothetical protein
MNSRRQGPVGPVRTGTGTGPDRTKKKFTHQDRTGPDRSPNGIGPKLWHFPYCVRMNRIASLRPRLFTSTSRVLSGRPVGLADDSMVERADFIPSSGQPILLDSKKHAVGYLVSRLLV